MSDLSHIDDKINWQDFYSRYLDVKRKGDRLIALCPFHDDSNPSLHIDPKTGRYDCKACEASGNAWTFLEKHEGLSRAEAAVLLKKAAGIADEPPRPKTAGLTVKQYAAAKKIPEEELRAYNLADSRGALLMPYMDESGRVFSTRKRHSMAGAVRFSWVRGAKVGLYGLFKLREARGVGYVVMVEGESDCHTLWHYGIPALGSPGADTFQPAWVKYVDGLRIYIFQEPDHGGEVFVKKVCRGLVEGRFDGQVYRLTIPGHKDPSALHLSGDDFTEKWKIAFNHAESVDIRSSSGVAEEVIPGQPFIPKKPDGWRYSESGVYRLDKKTGDERQIAPMPILIGKRLSDVDQGAERLEILFLRDGAWHTLRANKSTLYQRSKIPMLADAGLAVTSENAGDLVSYFFAMESANRDFLPVAHSIQRLGWVGSSKFMPGAADSIVLDLDDKKSMLGLAAGFRSSGSLNEWLEGILPVRKFTIPRFLIAASFASPLLHILNHRNFIIHAWGQSRGGKTASMKAALSVWGDPESIMVTFNTTLVGLERTCEFLSALPLGVDERQLAGDRQEYLDKLTYALTCGQGKTRGAKGGGLQAKGFWNLIILTTGEEALSGETSLQGVNTRALELYGVPIPDEQLAQDLHNIVDRHHGIAGGEFIKKLVARDKAQIINDYNFIRDKIRRAYPQLIQSYMTAIAAVALGDYYASQWVFGLNEDAAIDEMRSMISDVVAILYESQDEDYAQRAWDMLQAWTASNAERFKAASQPPHFGFYADTNCFELCIYPEHFKKAMKDAGFSVSRIRREFADRGWIATEKEGAKTRCDVRRWNGSAQIRVYALKRRD